MTSIHVIGIGLDGKAGLPQALLETIAHASLLVGSPRHLSYFPDAEAEVWPLGDLQAGLDRLTRWIAASPPGFAVVLTSGDPLFFGLGRLLVAAFPHERLTFHPHVTSIQLAFNRLQLPWQNATLLSAHGRSGEGLIAPLRRGDNLIAILTDGTNTPANLARMLRSLHLSHSYRWFICENLGGAQEHIHELATEAVVDQTFSPLNVVVLQRLEQPLKPTDLPLFGLPDQAFATFPDRPGLMTKREIRVQILADLALRPRQVVWDIGAGTGSVSVEINRLCPDSEIYAVEKTAAGFRLIETNRDHLGNCNLHPVQGQAPEALAPLPDPHRVFIGGSGGRLIPLLDACAQRLRGGGRMVLALATLEHLNGVMTWVNHWNHESPLAPWSDQYRQIQVQNSVQIGPLTRWQPLSPITVVTLIAATPSSD